MKAEHLKVGDEVIIPWLYGPIHTIVAILPPLLYPGHLTFHVASSTNPIHVPADRDLILFASTPVLS